MVPFSRIPENCKLLDVPGNLTHESQFTHHSTKPRLRYLYIAVCTPDFRM
jgi:hypothetical protein